MASMIYGVSKNKKRIGCIKDGPFSQVHITEASTFMACFNGLKIGHGYSSWSIFKTYKFKTLKNKKPSRNNPKGHKNDIGT